MEEREWLLSIIESVRGNRGVDRENLLAILSRCMPAKRTSERTFEEEGLLPDDTFSRMESLSRPEQEVLAECTEVMKKIVKQAIALDMN